MPTELNRIKELAGLQQEAAAISPNQIEAFKKWYATYSKMQSKDVYNYAKGIFKAHMETGVTELDGASKKDPRGKAYDDLAKIFPDMDGDIEAIGHQLKSQGVDPLDMEAAEESAVAEAPASGDQALAKDLANHFMKKANSFKSRGDTGPEYEEMVDIAKAFQQGQDQGMEEINDLANFEFSAHPFGGKFSNNEGEPEDEVLAILNKHGYSFTEKSHPERPNRGLVTLIKKGANTSKSSQPAAQPVNSSVDDTIQRARAQIETLESALKEDYKKFQGMKPYKPKKK